MGMKDQSQKYIKFFIYLVVVILINLAGITLFFRKDLTANKRYTLSEASRQVVSTLSEPLTVKVFFTKTLPAPHNNTERYLHDLLEEYAIFSKKYFSYEFYDVSPDEGDLDKKTWKNQETAENYGIHAIQIQNIESDEIKLQKAYMGMVLIHGDMIEKIPTITSTDKLEYNLTMAIRKLNNKISAFLNLEENIKVKLFFSASLNRVAPYMGLDDLPKLPDKLKEIVKQLSDKSYGKIKFEHLDPTIDELLKDSSNKYNLMTLNWPALSEGGIEPGEGVIGLVMEYGERAVTIQLIRVLRLPFIGTQYQMVALDEMEDIISENMESIIDINEDIGYLADHGSLSLMSVPSRGMSQMRAENASNFQSIVSRYYSIKEVNLSDSDIPDSLKCLIIAGPKEPFTDYELFQIDQFLMQGKSLALFLDVLDEVKQPQQQFGINQGLYGPLDTGLEKLLKHYGVRISQSYIMDEHCYRQNMPSHIGGGGERPIFFAPLIKNENINKDFEFMQNIKGLILMKTSPLEIIKDSIADNGLEAHKLISSSEEAWEMSERINLNPMFHRPPEDKEVYRRHALAYLLEGEFPSYFAGKPIPEKEIKEDETEKSDDSKESEKKLQDNDKPADLSKIKSIGQIRSKGLPGKIFLIASSEILKNNMIDKEGGSINSMFVLNMLDYLNNREEIAVMRSKEQRFNPLDDITAALKTSIKSFNIAGLPLLVVIFGLVVWFFRHSRKKRIQMMFQK